MTALREFLALARYAQTRLAVQWCQWRLERARNDLADALDANDRAWADVRAMERVPPMPAEPPAFLRATTDTEALAP